MSLGLLLVLEAHLVGNLLGLVGMGHVWILLLVNGSYEGLGLCGSRSEGLICGILLLVKRCHLLMLIEIIRLRALIRVLKAVFKTRLFLALGLVGTSTVRETSGGGLRGCWIHLALTFGGWLWLWVTLWIMLLGHVLVIARLLLTRSTVTEGRGLHMMSWTVVGLRIVFIYNKFRSQVEVN